VSSFLTKLMPSRKHSLKIPKASFLILIDYNWQATEDSKGNSRTNSAVFGRSMVIDTNEKRHQILSIANCKRFFYTGSRIHRLLFWRFMMVKASKNIRTTAVGMPPKTDPRTENTMFFHELLRHTRRRGRFDVAQKLEVLGRRTK
jgi:hypothetical protein